MCGSSLLPTGELNTTSWMAARRHSMASGGASSSAANRSGMSALAFSWVKSSATRTSRRWCVRTPLMSSKPISLLKNLASTATSSALRSSSANLSRGKYTGQLGGIATGS